MDLLREMKILAKQTRVTYINFKDYQHNNANNFDAIYSKVQSLVKNSSILKIF